MRYAKMSTQQHHHHSQNGPTPNNIPGTTLSRDDDLNERSEWDNEGTVFRTVYESEGAKEARKIEERNKAREQFEVGQKLKTPSGKVTQIRMIMSNAIECISDGISASIPFEKALTWDTMG